MDESVTHLFDAAVKGDAAAARRVYEQLYDELHRVARAQRRSWQGNETLNTTALIHEAYLKLIGSSAFENRAHFFASASRAMRQVLVSYARERAAEKRGGGVPNVTLRTGPQVDDRGLLDMIALDEALTRLAEESERGCRIAECRLLAGMTMEEIAAALDVSLATTKREWLRASTRLHDMLGKDAGA